jgi:hypothetical protein
MILVLEMNGTQPYARAQPARINGSGLLERVASAAVVLGRACKTTLRLLPKRSLRARRHMSTKLSSAWLVRQRGLAYPLGHPIGSEGLAVRR